KSPVPVHCIVEAIHSIVDNRINLREKWPNPHVEIDTYVIIPASVPFQDLVGEALVRLGYPAEVIPSARGSIIVKNWRPLPMEKVADEPLRSVAEILAELTTVATLKIQILRSQPPPASPAAEVKEKLLGLLILHSHALLASAGCPLDESFTSIMYTFIMYIWTYFTFGYDVSVRHRIAPVNTEDLIAGAYDRITLHSSKANSWQPSSKAPIRLYMTILLALPGIMRALASLVRGSNEISEETRRVFLSWFQQQHSLTLGPPPGNSLLSSCNNNRQLHNQSPLDTGGGVGPPHSHGHHPAMLPYSHKTRMRTSFDPELELPRLQRWFAENQHPSRQQIQRYVTELNSLESRRGRKPLDVNNVVYWFKNARAAQKRAENRGINGYSPPGLSPRGASIVSEDCSDEEDDSRPQSNSESPCLAGSPPVVGPLSLTTRSEDRLVIPTSTPTPVATATSTPVVKREEDSATRVSSGSEDEDSPPGVPTTPIPPGFSLVPSPMFSHSIMYMSHYLPTRGGPTGCPTSLLDERRKRNRTFIDPVTEVPRLENWFGHNTHPSHALILKYTEELNRMPYRQKFPRLEPKNVQFWFKNRRAKCKRLKMALFEGESPQPHPYAHAD
ncbi:hypothetical protein G9C98_005806, partial [Cotesia typhae]